MFQDFECSAARARLCRESGAWPHAPAKPERNRYVSNAAARAMRGLAITAMRTTSGFMRGLQLPRPVRREAATLLRRPDACVGSFLSTLVQIIQVIRDNEVPELPYYLDRSNICAAN